MGSAYTAKPAAREELPDVPPGWGGLTFEETKASYDPQAVGGDSSDGLVGGTYNWPYLGPTPPEYEYDYSIYLDMPSTVSTSMVLDQAYAIIKDKGRYRTIDSDSSTMTWSAVNSEGDTIRIRELGNSTWEDSLEITTSRFNLFYSTNPRIEFNLTEDNVGETITLSVACIMSEEDLAQTADITINNPNQLLLTYWTYDGDYTPGTRLTLRAYYKDEEGVNVPTSEVDLRGLPIVLTAFVDGEARQIKEGWAGTPADSYTGAWQDSAWLTYNYAKLGDVNAFALCADVLAADHGKQLEFKITAAVTGVGEQTATCTIPINFEFDMSAKFELSSTLAAGWRYDCRAGFGGTKTTAPRYDSYDAAWEYITKGQSHSGLWTYYSIGGQSVVTYMTPYAWRLGMGEVAGIYTKAYATVPTDAVGQTDYVINVYRGDDSIASWSGSLVAADGVPEEKDPGDTDTSVSNANFFTIKSNGI